MGSYIFNKYQYVEIDGSNSTYLFLISGVHQYSILCSLFFITYITNITHASTLLDWIIYADDTTLSTTLVIIMRNTKLITADICIGA